MGDVAGLVVKPAEQSALRLIDFMALRSDPPLPRPEYHFIWRHDDSRHLVEVMKRLITEEVDFSAENPLWTV